MEYQTKKIIFIPLSHDVYLFNSGSERIRCRWLAPLLSADIYDGTQNIDNYDVIIYQKCYLSKQSKELSTKYKDTKLQIFDICDPEWKSFPNEFREMAEKCSFITTSTQDLTNSLRQMGYQSYPIVDRINFEYFKGIKKQHTDTLVWLIWFGYGGRFEEVKPLIPYIEKLELPMLVISDRPVGYGRFIKWTEETWLRDIIKGDIVLNPQREFKTNIYTNKSLTAWTLGMPVAETKEDIKRFMDFNERVKESELRLKEVQQNWDISQSAKELLGLIMKYETSKNKS